MCLLLSLQLDNCPDIVRRWSPQPKRRAVRFDRVWRCAQDILPREVLEDDGSRSDRHDANRRQVNPNYSNAHWYKTGEGSDPHGDLQEKNRARRDHEEHEMQQQREVDEQREHEAEAARRQQSQLRVRRAAAMQELREHRTGRKSNAPARHWGTRSSAPSSYAEMQKELKTEDAQRRAQILKNSGLAQKGGADARPHAHYQGATQTNVKSRVFPGKVTYAYKHPFAADKLGMQNLVMAEFSQDENRMQATTSAIFGNKSDKSKWSHGGLLLSDVNQAPPRTLHEAMQARRARMRAQAKHQELAEEAQLRRREAKHALTPRRVAPRLPRPHVRCSIEMLEHGECSVKPHVGTHGDLPTRPSPTAAKVQPHAAATRTSLLPHAHFCLYLWLSARFLCGMARSVGAAALCMSEALESSGWCCVGGGVSVCMLCRWAQ